MLDIGEHAILFLGALIVASLSSIRAWIFISPYPTDVPSTQKTCVVLKTVGPCFAQVISPEGNWTFRLKSFVALGIGAAW